MTKILFLLLTLNALLCGTLYGQDYAKIDSLKKELKVAKSDTLKAKLLSELSLKYNNFAPDTGLIYGKEGLALAQKTGENKYIAKCFNNIGVIYRTQDDCQRALISFHQSQEIYKRMGDLSGLAASVNNIATIYSIQGDFPQALSFYQQSRKIFETLRDQQGLAIALLNIGHIHSAQKSGYSQAMDYYQQSRKICEAIGDKKRLAKALSGIGNIYLNQGNYSQALNYFQQSRKICELLGNQYELALILSYLGDVYFDRGDYPQALFSYQQSRKIRETIGDPAGLAEILNSIGIIYLRQSNINEARICNIEAVSLGRQIGSKTILNDSYKLLSKIDSTVGDYRSALEHYKLAVVYKDSLYNEEKTKEIGRIEGKYEIEKQQEVEKQKQAAAAEAAQRRNNLQYLLIFAGVAVFFLALFFIGKLKLPLVFSEGLIFMAFLMLFEFLLIFLEPFFDKYTGGIPIQKLGLNIILSFIFTPLHSFLEGQLRKRVVSTEIPEKDKPAIIMKQALALLREIKAPPVSEKAAPSQPSQAAPA